MEILKQVNNKSINIESLNITKHMQLRHYRLLNKNYISNNNIYKCFVVDKHHKNGLELHVILKSATILIFNNSTKKLITILNARKGQLLRYDKTTPNFIIRKAIENVKKNQNI